MAEDQGAKPDAEVRRLDEKNDKDAKNTPGGKGFLKSHRDQILIVLTLTGVIIAWLAMRKPAAASASGSSGSMTSGGTGYDPTAAAGTPSTAGPDASGGALDGFSAYLSHMSDQLNTLEATVSAGSAGTGGGTGSSTPPAFDYSSMNHSWAGEPVSAAPRFLFGRAAQGLRYVRNRATGQIGQVNPNGKIFWLRGAQYSELGRPKATDYGRAPKPKKDPVRHPIHNPPRRPRPPRNTHPSGSHGGPVHYTPPPLR